jgi:hypothetical protein
MLIKNTDDFIRDMPYDKWYPTKGNQEVVELIKEYINLDVFFPDAVMCLNKDESKFQKAKIPKLKPKL